MTAKPSSGGGYGPGGSWGLVELILVVAGPLFLLFLLLMGVSFLYQYHQRNYSHRQRLEVDDPSCDHLYSAKDRSLQDLIYDLSTSGSGSGECLRVRTTFQHCSMCVCAFVSLLGCVCVCVQACLCLSSELWPEPLSFRRSSEKDASEKCGVVAGGAETWL